MERPDSTSMPNIMCLEYNIRTVNNLSTSMGISVSPLQINYDRVSNTLLPLLETHHDQKLPTMLQ